MSSDATSGLTFPVGSQIGQGYLARPAGAAPWPAVVVIQEWWGLDAHIRSIADRLATAGFVALAPDLYNGVVAREPDEARKLAMALEWDHALAVIQGAVDHLIGSGLSAAPVVGVVGFCMGGGLAWHAAAKVRRIGAAAPFYGGGPELSAAEVARIQAPVLAIYGELDRGVSPEVARRRAHLMDQAGVPHETIIYPGAHHAFFNDTRPIYNPTAAQDAWRRLISLFQRTLTPHFD